MIHVVYLGIIATLFVWGLSNYLAYLDMKLELKKTIMQYHQQQLMRHQNGAVNSKKIHTN